MAASTSRSRVLEEIRTLDPEADHQRIVFLSTCFDFPFDTTRALELALFRTFCIPSISRLLDRTGEFQKRAQKRYDDTDILVSEMLEWGYASERGSSALHRMNQLHGRFRIANDDFLYVLSTFVFEPVRWNERFGWRPLCEQERLGMFYFWREIGRRMNIADLPESYDELEAFNRDYERRHLRYSDANRRVGLATMNMFTDRVPRVLCPLARSAIHALLEVPLIRAFGFPQPSRLMRWLVPATLRLRARLARFLPARTQPRLRSRMKRPSYPDGYRIEQIGPPPAG
jgi:ER-bound oxygenase mpaB/B'/Rubber oxygenase, catalytic domain